MNGILFQKLMTKVQIITIGAYIAYIIWEIIVWFWARSLPDYDPIIRADLLIILPVLLILTVISLFQYFRKKKTS